MTYDECKFLAEKCVFTIAVGVSSGTSPETITAMIEQANAGRGAQVKLVADAIYAACQSVMRSEHQIIS